MRAVRRVALMAARRAVGLAARAAAPGCVRLAAARAVGCAADRVPPRAASWNAWDSPVPRPMRSPLDPRARPSPIPTTLSAAPATSSPRARRALGRRDRARNQLPRYPPVVPITFRVMVRRYAERIATFRSITRSVMSTFGKSHFGGPQAPRRPAQIGTRLPLQTGDVLQHAVRPREVHLGGPSVGQLVRKRQARRW